MNHKKCIRCGEQKPASDFYTHPKMADGYLGKCKECCRNEAIKNREKNIDRYRAQDKIRNQNPDRVEARLERQRQGLCNHIKKAYAGRNPEKRAAHIKVGNAVRDGVLIKPKTCPKCLRETRIIGHHQDYSKPLEVEWMCNKCHWLLHNGGGE